MMVFYEYGITFLLNAPREGGGILLVNSLRHQLIFCRCISMTSNLMTFNYRGVMKKLKFDTPSSHFGGEITSSICLYPLRSAAATKSATVKN